jgi:hypothetical protein
VPPWLHFRAAARIEGPASAVSARTVQIRLGFLGGECGNGLEGCFGWHLTDGRFGPADAKAVTTIKARRAALKIRMSVWLIYKPSC